MTWDDSIRRIADEEKAEAEARPNGSADVRPPAFSDDALALRFSTEYGSSLRYVAEWGKWLRWLDNRWAFDRTLDAFDLARSICRDAAREAGTETKIAAAIASCKTATAVEKLARADRRHVATTEQWDQEPWLLTTKGNGDE